MKRIFVLVVGMFVAAGAFAKQFDYFKDADKDKDGFLSKEEFVNQQVSAAKRGNKKVDVPKYEKKFAMKDADGDGRLTRAEYETPTE